MNRECQNFRSFLLEKQDGQDLPHSYSAHLQICTDCREYYQNYGQALGALKGGLDLTVPETISRKLHNRLFKPKVFFRPAYAFVIAALLIIAVFSPRHPYSPKSFEEKPSFTLNNIYYNGRPADIFIEQNKNFVNIFITGKEN